MIRLLKNKIKKQLLLLSGRYPHLKHGVSVRKEWYGNDYGGFFVSPDYVGKNAIVYSFGVGEDISFDEAMIAHHNCQVFAFDPTPKSIRWVEKNKTTISGQFTFHAYGIAVKSGNADFYLPKNEAHVSGSFVSQNNVNEKQKVTVEMKSLPDIMKMLGHHRIDVLKMDIEGAEYQVLENILSSNTLIGQILIEFHDRFFDDGLEKTKQAIARLRQAGFEVFGVSDSMEEISLIHKSCFLNNKFN